MGKRKSWQCSCGEYAHLQCDWPEPVRQSGICEKAVCRKCARHVDGKDFCPFHRGEPPMTNAEKLEAGAAAAAEAAKILGIKR